eukprot:3467423-Rhodomonas_salina.1
MNPRAEPARRPVVMATLTECPSPEGTKPVKEESERHSVLSHALDPVRAAMDDAKAPNTLPTIVTADAPVPARLLASAEVASGREYDMGPDRLPAALAPVTANRSDARTPASPRHRRLLSDVHALASHAEPPTRDLDVRRAVPKPEPYTDTTVLPVAARLAC